MRSYELPHYATSYYDESALVSSELTKNGALTEAQKEIRRRSRRVARKLGITIPKMTATNLHLAVAYCHEEMEIRRERENEREA